MTEGEAQAALAALALELIAIADRLQAIHDELPASPAREAMWAHVVMGLRSVQSLRPMVGLPPGGARPLAALPEAVGAGP